MMRSTEGARRSTLYPDRVPERAALYRRYRSQTFAEVIGQEHVTRTLKNAIASGQVAHAYLLAGARGIGKTSIARIIAKAVNCPKAKDGDPCDTCESCVAIREGRFLDLIEIDAASNRGIDEMRDLREKVRFAPSMGQYKVYVIDEAHQLTNEAFNALLKTLEEPPAHVIFVLATTEAQRIPATTVATCGSSCVGRWITCGRSSLCARRTRFPRPRPRASPRSCANRRRGSRSTAWRRSRTG